MRKPGEANTAASGHVTADKLLAALRAGKVGTWHWDRRTGRVEWDTALEGIFGLASGTFGSTIDDWLALVHPDDLEDVTRTLREATTRPDPSGRYRTQHRIVGPEGEVRWMEGRGQVAIDDDGDVVGIVGIGYDVTDRAVAEQRTAELLRAEQALRARLALLAEASTVLTRFLNADATLRELAKLVVPRLADQCQIHEAARGDLRLVAAAGAAADTGGDALLTGEHGPLAVARTGEPRLVGRVDQRVLEQITDDHGASEALAAVGAASAMVVPLRARGRTLGALTLLSHDPDRIYDHEDLVLAVDLGQRAGIAVDNARLFAEQRRVATILQDSLLPPTLPDVPGGVVSGRYEPAMRGFDVGGDFYDLFENSDQRTWTVLIGDVRGKGPDAAALSSLCRHTVRAAAMREPDPVRILGVLNEVLLKDDPLESFCTAVCVRLDPTPHGLGGRVGGAGHPPAIVVRANGALEQVPSTAVLVGLFGDIDIEGQEVVLAPGDGLFLYTDGVLDARRGNELFGHERLHRVLSEHAGSCAEHVVGSVVAAIRDFRDDDHRDDVAVLCITATSDADGPDGVASVGGLPRRDGEHAH